MLMRRYQNTIRFTSWGHKHREKFYINQDEDDTPYLFNLIHGGITPYDHGNPGFYVIDWHKEYMVPVNIHTYVIDLETGDWSLDRSFREDYGLPDLSPSSIKARLNNMYDFGAEGKRFVHKYMHNLYNGYREVPQDYAEYKAAEFLEPHSMAFKCDL